MGNLGGDGLTSPCLNSVLVLMVEVARVFQGQRQRLPSSI